MNKITKRTLIKVKIKNENICILCICSLHSFPVTTDILRKIFKNQEVDFSPTFSKTIATREGIYT